MSDLFEHWVRRVRGAGVVQTASAGSEVEREIGELHRLLTDIADRDRLRALRQEVEAAVASLQAEHDRLQSELATAERDTGERRKKIASADLDAVQAILDRRRTRIDLEIITASKEILPEVDGASQISPEQLKRLLENKAPIARTIRHRIRDAVVWASEEARRTEGLLTKVADLRSRIASLEAEAENLRRDLQNRHQVEPSVLDALQRLSPAQRQRLLVDFLKPRLQDAKIEHGWALPEDVLGEVGAQP